MTETEKLIATERAKARRLAEVLVEVAEGMRREQVQTTAAALRAIKRRLLADELDTEAAQLEDFAIERDEMAKTADRSTADMLRRLAREERAQAATNRRRAALYRTATERQDQYGAQTVLGEVH